MSAYMLQKKDIGWPLFHLVWSTFQTSTVDEYNAASLWRRHSSCGQIVVCTRGDIALSRPTPPSFIVNFSTSSESPWPPPPPPPFSPLSALPRFLKAKLQPTSKYERTDGRANHAEKARAVHISLSLPLSVRRWRCHIHRRPVPRRHRLRLLHVDRARPAPSFLHERCSAAAAAAVVLRRSYVRLGQRRRPESEEKN